MLNEVLIQTIKDLICRRQQ